jgi:hypothetical protein
MPRRHRAGLFRAIGCSHEGNRSLALGPDVARVTSSVSDTPSLSCSLPPLTRRPKQYLLIVGFSFLVYWLPCASNTTTSSSAIFKARCSCCKIAGNHGATIAQIFCLRHLLSLISLGPMRLVPVTVQRNHSAILSTMVWGLRSRQPRQNSFVGVVCYRMHSSCVSLMGYCSAP